MDKILRRFTGRYNAPNRQPTTTAARAYSQKCCYSANAVVENDQRIIEAFGKIYGGRAKPRSLEGLVAGKTNLAQGAFRPFAHLAAQEFGDGDPITKRAQVLLARAVEEKKQELKDEEEGAADLKFGCLTLGRDMSKLNLEMPAVYRRTLRTCSCLRPGPTYGFLARFLDNPKFLSQTIEQHMLHKLPAYIR